jgi:hypothetical protein
MLCSLVLWPTLPVVPKVLLQRPCDRGTCGAFLIRRMQYPLTAGGRRLRIEVRVLTRRIAYFGTQVVVVDESHTLRTQDTAHAIPLAAGAA